MSQVIFSHLKYSLYSHQKQTTHCKLFTELWHPGMKVVPPGVMHTWPSFFKILVSYRNYVSSSTSCFIFKLFFLNPRVFTFSLLENSSGCACQ